METRIISVKSMPFQIKFQLREQIILPPVCSLANNKKPKQTSQATATTAPVRHKCVSKFCMSNNFLLMCFSGHSSELHSFSEVTLM